MKLLSIFFILVFTFTACAPTATENKNQNTISATPSPSPLPTISAEEKAKQEKEDVDERQKAIRDFVATSHTGWKLEGVPDDFEDCEEYSNAICDLLLSKGQQKKVIAVKLKRFIGQDGISRLIVFEARPIDLSQAKIERIREITLENLEEADCESFIEEAENN